MSDDPVTFDVEIPPPMLHPGGVAWFATPDGLVRCRRCKDELRGQAGACQLWAEGHVCELGWLGIPKLVLAEEDRTMNARLTAGDVCNGEVDGIPRACVRPPGHEGRCYRLPHASEL